MLVSSLVFTTLIVCDVVLWKTVPCNPLNVLDGRTAAAMLLVLAGVGLRSWAAGTLRKTEVVIRSGPYQFVRNPLYIGSFLMMLGFSLLLHDWIAFWIVLGPLLALYLNKVHQEELFLTRTFPTEWNAYAAEVPRFIPRLNAWPSLEGFSWRQWLANDEYQGVVATLAGLVAIWMWHLAVAR
jgi:protein-S-isoprenylcysteine O-methyltransferase Ste14